MLNRPLLSSHMSPLRTPISVIACLIALFGTVPLLGATPDDTERQPVIRQTSLTDCGLAALAMLLRDKASVTTSVDKLDSLAAVLIDPRTRRHRREGYSISELNPLAAAFAYSLKAHKLTSEELSTRSLPLIAWVDLGNGGHFTLAERATATSVSLADPTRGRVSVDLQTWRNLWLQGTTGIVL